MLTKQINKKIRPLVRNPKFHKPCTEKANSNRYAGGQDSSVGIATRYGLDDPGIESGWGGGEIFQTGPGAHPASCTMVTGSFSGVKRPGRGADPRTPIFSAEVLNWVELYLYPP